MRISDWSSDVCSADLALLSWHADSSPSTVCRMSSEAAPVVRREPLAWLALLLAALASLYGWWAIGRPVALPDAPTSRIACVRSEEHTSELQSLMRISYAVFCLKNTKTKHHKTCT